jgi:hypothetical protein
MIKYPWAIGWRTYCNKIASKNDYEALKIVIFIMEPIRLQLRLHGWAIAFL